MATLPFPTSCWSGVHSIICSTSISDTAPSTANIKEALRSLRKCPRLLDTPLVVVADKVPTDEEMIRLAPVDRDKWAALWKAKRDDYELYLDALETWIPNLPGGQARLVRLAEFGHLVGTVECGLACCGAEDNDGRLQEPRGP